MQNNPFKTIIKGKLEEVMVQIKDLLKNDCIHFLETKKNIETSRTIRRDLGITHNDFMDEIKEAISNLSMKNYFQGPEQDHNEKRDLIFWIFGIKIFENKEIYLKFSITEKEGQDIICWSYHFPEDTITYPFK